MMKGFQFSALLGAIALSLPTVAISDTTFPAAALAQTSLEPTALAQSAATQRSAVDNTYLSELYTFLASQDTITHAMATEAMSPEDSVWAAQMFCRTFEAGVSPEDAFSVYTSSAISQATSQGVELTEEMAYAVGLYGGAVMNIGAAHYCSEYQAEVEAALQSM
ncbi:MAG: hypothetical protein AAF635_13950 [Cyanobacteria bacterium P01_C01_bin.69]